VRFAYAIAYVRDVERSVAFYEQAFSLQRRFVDESGQYAEMETGETTLAFASNQLGASNLPGDFRRNDPAEPPAGIEIAFLTEDVGVAFRKALEAGATSAAENQALGADRCVREGPGRHSRRNWEPDLACSRVCLADRFCFG
jgi:lactoylglutathione lyase